jgi:hypothetical protein
LSRCTTIVRWRGLRTREYAAAVQDAGWVLEIIGEGYHPAMEEVVRGEEYVGAEEGAG